MSQFLSRENKFSFTCPIFNAEVEMRTCVYLREKVYMGKYPTMRRGCQACISNGKCPAAEMVRRLAFKTGDATDHCGSTEPKHGKIPADVLERIAPIVVLESTLLARNVTAEERELIASSRERIEAQIATAPRERPSQRRVLASTQEAPRRASQKRTQSDPQVAAVSPTTVNKAAATGDLAAALNAA